MRDDIVHLAGDAPAFISDGVLGQLVLHLTLFDEEFLLAAHEKPTSQPIATNERYRAGVFKRCIVVALTSRAAADEAASPSPRIEVIPLTTPTVRLSRRGAKSPVMGVGVAKRRIAVPKVHAAQIAGPSYLLELLRSKEKKTISGTRRSPSRPG